MLQKPRRLLALLLLSALALCLAGCGSGSSGGGSGSGAEDIRLLVWAPSEDQAQASGEWLQTCCNNFAALHPEWNITFNYGVADEATSASTVAYDPEDSADVFMYANDNITVLTDAKALAKIGGKYADEIKSFTSQALVDSVSLDGYLYGVPYTTNTWFMYYDKSFFTEEDVKSLEAMLAKGRVAFPFTNSWYLPAFYVANGCTLFGNNNQEELGVDFGGENAAEVTDYLIDLAANPNFVIDNDGAGMAGLRDGSIHAIFTGSWDAPSIKEILGDNMGAVAPPCFDLNGEEKQMMAYAGSKAIGVNAHSEHMVAAVELAIYLGSAEAQKLHYELRSTIPSNTELLTHEDITADPVVIAQNDTFDRTSILQPTVSAMGNCWTPVQNMGESIRNGTTTHANAAEQTEGMNAAMNSNGIS